MTWSFNPVFPGTPRFSSSMLKNPKIYNLDMYIVTWLVTSITKYPQSVVDDDKNDVFN